MNEDKFFCGTCKYFTGTKCSNGQCKGNKMYNESPACYLYENYGLEEVED